VLCKSLFWGSKRRHLVEESLPVEKSERNSTYDFDERRPLSVSQRPSRRQKAVRPQEERWKGNRRDRERKRERKREEPSEAKWFEHQSAPSPSRSVPLVGLSKFGCALAVDRRAVGQLYSSHGYEHLFTLAEAHSLCSPSVCIVCALFRCLKKQATKRNIWMTRSDLCKSEAVWRFVIKWLLVSCVVTAPKTDMFYRSVFKYYYTPDWWRWSQYGRNRKRTRVSLLFKRTECLNVFITKIVWEKANLIDFIWTDL
jgi:hypothetical protein